MHPGLDLVRQGPVKGQGKVLRSVIANTNFEEQGFGFACRCVARVFQQEPQVRRMRVPTAEQADKWAEYNGGQIDANDFNVLTEADVSLSTAMLNGARFSFVSPGGTMPPAVGGHVLDGGYFDAAGIETMREAAAVVLNRRLTENALHRASLLPIFVLLENGAPADTPRSGKAQVARSVDAPPGSSSHTAPGQGYNSKPPGSRTDTFAPDEGHV